ncbi:DUF4346 domain-containing protein [Candidatus Woesearchaeota archaeon]|nr:DUF4346 domain-containing protein [Candidatus Woesearchaeota archaeon]
MVKKKFIWIKQKEHIRQMIKARHNPFKEWHPDSKGYFLIRVAHNRIEVGYVTTKHVISKMIYGTNAIELYNTIIRKKLLTRIEHAAYLGKEFYKAELALKYGKKYIQEFPLKFKEGVKVKLTVES